MLVAVVIEAHVMLGAASEGSLKREPVTIARLRDDGGGLHDVRIVGGPNRFGGVTRLAGYVVPVVGARVRLDLADDTPRSPGARAWVQGNPAATWGALPVDFVLARPGSRDLGAEAERELAVALRTWGLPSCTSFRARITGTEDLTPADDGKNGVFFHDASWPAELLPGALAQTILHTDANGKLRDTDIHVNGADYKWSLDGRAGTWDARGVLVHEIGHALGLGHTNVARATMVATPPAPLAWRSLEKDDRDGVCALYPGAGDPGCETGDPCPTGFVCVARACERAGAPGVACAPCERVVGACDGAGDEGRCADLAPGPTCTRGCAGDAECGPRFRCQATTSSGDLQCVPVDDACAAWPRAPVVRDAGADAPDGGDGGVERMQPDGGCALSRGRGDWLAVALALGLAAARRRGGASPRRSGPP